MPNKVLVFNVIGIVLQYSLLILLYYFLFRVVKLVAIDLIKPKRGVAIESNNSSRSSHNGKLIVLDSGHLTLAQTIFILDDTNSIGRNEHNGIIIDDAFVSYEHANINKNKQGYWLVDLNSTNKTYLNGQAITDGVLLKNDDIIKIGAVTFRFEG